MTANTVHNTFILIITVNLCTSYRINSTNINHTLSTYKLNCADCKTHQTLVKNKRTRSNHFIPIQRPTNFITYLNDDMQRQNSNSSTNARTNPRNQAENASINNESNSKSNRFEAVSSQPPTPNQQQTERIEFQIRGIRHEHLVLIRREEQ